MSSLNQLQKEIAHIKQRNEKVEADKAWETSLSRKIVISIATYIVIVLFLFAAGIPRPWLNAVIPAVAFVLSTLTLPFFKKLWLRYIFKKT